MSPAHPFHLTPPSPWPAVGAGSAFVLALGALGYMHGGGPWALVAGAALVLFTMAGWWARVIRDGAEDQAHTPAVQRGLRVGMGMFITSEVMFFVAFFWAFFNNALLINPSIRQWPPPGIEPLEAWGLPFVNTCLLLLSGLTCNWAHHSIRSAKRRDALIAVAITIALGSLFLTFQAVEYGRAAFKFTDGVYPSVFYMATGFHGFHVFIGLCFLAVSWGRIWVNQLTPEHHVGFEANAWYWHFVDVVWLFLFIWIYWWGG